MILTTCDTRQSDTVVISLAAEAGQLSGALRFRLGAGFGPAVKPDELLLTDIVEPDELLLTDFDRLRPDELMLDDILAELGPDSRVVRLFDPNAIPTPGQLNDRIARHIREGSSPAPAPPDASQALHDALAELRRSLR